MSHAEEETGIKLRRIVMDCVGVDSEFTSCLLF